MADMRLLWEEETHPRGATIYLKTYGCTHNVADSERMAGLLTAAGYTITHSPEQADLLLINSCTVKGPAEQRFLHDIRSAELPIVVAGCVPQADRNNPAFNHLPTVGVKNIHRVVEVVDRALQGEVVRHLDHAHHPSLALPRIRKNQFVEIIPINSGCLGSCTFCKTVQARGRLQSYPKEEVLAAIGKAVGEGVKEIWLTSEDVATYGLDIGETLITLLNDIAALEGDFMVRLGMGNPPHFQRYVEELAALLQEHPDRFYHFLHLPAQSGSDAVLKGMNREYTRGEFDACIAAFERIPDITLATDIILGFPNEREEDFQKTVQLVKGKKFRIININKFYPRPGTPASRMQLLPTEVVAARCKQIVQEFEQQHLNRTYHRTTQRVLFTEQGKHGSLIGHTRSYIQVVVKESPKNILGSWQSVRITEANKYHLVGELIRNGDTSRNTFK